MLVLSLDEQGDFEYLEKNKKGPIFIGGVVFDDKNIEGEYETEKARIEAYYKAVCRDCSTDDIELKYPGDLHVNRSNTNGKMVALAKEGVTKTIKEFLCQGTFNGEVLCDRNGEALKSRSGQYYPYIFIKSDIEKMQYNNSNNDFLYERTSSNLYYYMVRDTLNRIIAQTDNITKSNDYSLMIATRSTPTFPTTDNRRHRYEKNGYIIEYNDNDNNPITVRIKDGTTVKGFRVQLTNKDVYRTVLRELLIENAMFEANIELKVKSIRYEAKTSNQEFLYLADSICSVFSFGLKGTCADEYFTSILDRVNDVINSEQMLLHSFSPVDDCYSKAYEEIKRKNYYGAFQHMYEGSIMQGVVADYYKNNLFPKLEEKIVSEFDIKSYEQAIIYIEKSLKSNTYDINCNKFIVDHILGLIDKSVEYNQADEFKGTIFRLYSSAISAYSHIGDPKGAKAAYNKALKYGYFASTEEFLRMRNKMVVFLTDMMEYDQALKIAEDNIELQEEVAKLKEKINVLQAPDKYIERNKTYSQLGQTYAFMKNSKAEECFKEAMVGMKKRSANYYITESYLLHYYLDNGMRDAYEKKAKEYFGGNFDLERQFDYIVEQGNIVEPLISVSFGLYVYLKALWVFYKDNISDELLNRLCTITNVIKKEGKKYTFNAHPDELNLKYLMLLMVHKNQIDKTYKKYCRLYEKCAQEQGPLVKIIWLFGNIEIKIYESGFDEVKELVNELWYMLINEFDLGDLSSVNSEEERWKYLSNILVYMYN